MKYYIVADVHGFFSEMKRALDEKGFFTDTVPHKLIVCGDMMDRGGEAVGMQEFMAELLHKNELIFIRGNHEDLLVEMIEHFERHAEWLFTHASHHNQNGTWDTALQLSGMTEAEVFVCQEKFLSNVKASGFYKELIPASVDYFETENYVFVHGWIPSVTEKMPPWYTRGRSYEYNPDWRNANRRDWEQARWLNGMVLAEGYGIVETGKAIVCGHWHASYGHARFEKKGSEFGADADFTPYYGKNIIAIDGCTGHSGLVNCLVIEE